METPTVVTDKNNERDWRTCAVQMMDSISIGSLKVSIDHESLRGEGLKAFRAQSPVYSFYAPSGNGMLTVPKDTPDGPFYNVLSVSDGYWVMIEPLRPGRHTIHFEAENTSGNWGQNVTYNLTVTK